MFNDLGDRMRICRTRAEVEEKLAAVEPGEAELVKLRYFTGLSFEEAAATFGPAAAAVGMVMFTSATSSTVWHPWCSGCCFKTVPNSKRPSRGRPLFLRSKPHWTISDHNRKCKFLVTL